MGASALEAWASERNLSLEEHQLKTKPRARHWHLRHRRLAGTVELTSINDVWTIEVRKNRQGPWITEELIADLRELLSAEAE